MIRNLRILVAAAMALMALGAIGASSAHAVEEKFHCSVAECRLTPKTDGTLKNAHHVFIVENEAKTESASFTCESIRGHAREGKTGIKITLTEITYDNCTINGSSGVTVDMNGCDYLFTQTNQVDVICPTEKTIELRIPGCTFTIHGQTNLGGIGYTTIGKEPEREVTVSTNVTVPEVTVSDPCTFIKPGQKLIGTYTTGFTTVTGETEAGARADAWFL
jgi:hypothetical protein